MTRGEIWQVEFENSSKNKVSFPHPALIVQDNSFNESSIKTILVLPITSNLNLLNAPGNVLIKRRESKLIDDAVIIVSQLYAMDRVMFKKKISKVDKTIMNQVEVGLKLVLGINK